MDSTGSMTWIIRILALILLPLLCIAGVNTPNSGLQGDGNNPSTSDTEADIGLLDCQKSNFSVIRSIIPPYTLPTEEVHSLEGPIHDIAALGINRCCGSHVPIVVSQMASTERDVEEKMKAEDLAYPVVKTGNLGIAAGAVDGYVFVPIMETPGAVVLVKDDGKSPNVVIQSLSECWPLALVVISSAGLAGVIVWLLDHSRNPDDFAKSFIQGGWEGGIWWAFVTMTTVGYGDKAPKSIFGRIFGLIWMFVGIILMSIFTATLTTALTADQSSELEMKGTKIGIVKGSKEEILAFKEGAVISAFNTAKELIDGLTEGSVEGALMDSNYALSKGTDLDNKDITIAVTLENPAILGIILQGLAAEIETCFTKHISKSQFKAYDYLGSHVQKFHKDETPSATKATQKVLLNLTAVYAVLFCLWFLGTLACILWECNKRRKIGNNKTSEASNEVVAWDTTTKVGPATADVNNIKT